MHAVFLTEAPLGETLLSPGVALRDFRPEAGESASSLRARAREAIAAGRALGRTTGGEIVLEPLIRLDTEGVRRTPGAAALDGWRVRLCLRLASLPPPEAVLPSLADGRLTLREPEAFPLTWLGETPGGVLVLHLPRALATGPVTLRLALKGETECRFTALDGAFLAFCRDS